MQWQNTAWNPPYLIITNQSRKQSLTRNNCRTIFATPTTNTSKRAARPGMVCYFFSCRYALPCRRNSQKTMRKIPHSKPMGRHRKKTENDTLFWSHITQAYGYVETRFKRQTADADVDFLAVQTGFKYDTRFVRYRSSKCVCSKQSAQARVSHGRWERTGRVTELLPSETFFSRTNRPHGQDIHFTRTSFGHFVATLAVFHPMSLPKRRHIHNWSCRP